MYGRKSAGKKYTKNPSSENPTAEKWKKNYESENLDFQSLPKKNPT